MNIGIPQRFKFIAATTTVILIGSVAAQGLASAQAERLGYVQSSCPALVQQAFDTISSQCSKAARGKICYGNTSISVELQPGAPAGIFSQPGDTLDVAQVKQLTLGSMDVTSSSWGIAELKIQADLPDSDASQFVTMILFGNTQLTDATTDANIDALSQTPGALARQDTILTATTRAIDRQATAGAIKAGGTATRLTILEGTATARAATPTATGTIPVYRETIAAATANRLANMEYAATALPSTTPTTLPVISGPYKGGLQAFYFQSTDSAPCAQAPHDGLLLQSPQGSKERVTLSIDGATVTLGSTVYITAQPNKFMMVNTLEGSADVTADGKTLTAAAGSSIHIPLDANLRPAGPPTPIDSIYYTSDEVRALPISALPTVISPIAGLSSSSQLYSGTVTITGSPTFTGNCGPNPGLTNVAATKITAAVDDGAGQVRLGAYPLTKAPDGSYQGSQNVTTPDGVTSSVQFNVKFTDPLTLTGLETTKLTGGKINANCTITLALRISLSTASAATAAATVTSG